MSILNYIDVSQMKPEIIDGLPVRWYGLLFATAFLTGFYILRKIFRNDVQPQEEADKWMDKILMYVMIGTIVGARLGHVFFYQPGYYIQNPLEIIMIWEGGLASHGGAIGIIIAMYFFAKKVSHKSMLWGLDRLVIVVASGAFFIRMGNFINQEIVGSPSNAPWAILFNGYLEPRHPAQFYEGISYLVIFSLLFYMYWKTNAKQKSGLLFGVFLTLVFTARFIIEYFKEVQVEWELDYALKQGQMLSIPFILTGLFFIVKSLLKKN